MRQHALRETFVRAVDATVELERARHLLAELHYKLDEVDNAKFMLENVGRWAPPSDDAHEVLFERVKRAETELETLLAQNIVHAIKASIERATTLAAEASSHLDRELKVSEG